MGTGGWHESAPPSPPSGRPDGGRRAVEAVSFDFYGTLAYHRTGEGRGRALVSYLAAQGFETAPWEHQMLYDVFAGHGRDYVPGAPDPWARRYRERFAAGVFRRLGIDATDATVARHADAVWDLLGPACLALFPDVVDAVRAVRERGLGTAVVSNWQSGLEHFCRELGLGALFDHVLASADVGSAKPDRGIFDEAARRLGVPAGRILHVGDTPVDDVEGGAAAGFQVLLLQRDGPSPAPPDRTIRTLAALPERLAPP